MLSYDDRIKILRETKIKHTLLKKEQNGYTDLDDFGTVPLPENYKVEPWFNSENGSFYGYDGMSENFCRVMDAHPAYVDPLEMLCGRWRDMLVNYRGDLHYMPKWRKEQLKDEDMSGISSAASPVTVGAEISAADTCSRMCFQMCEIEPHRIIASPESAAIQTETS